jgi:phage major head subunit gpT-like protein
MICDTVFLEKLLKANFEDGIQELLKLQPEMSALFMEIASEAASEKYGWLGDFPQLREWVGDKQSSFIHDYDYSIKNQDWECSIDVDRNEIEDDQIGKLGIRCNSIVQSFAGWKQELVIELIENSLTALAYDGSAFFANRAAPNDNLLAGSGADTILHIIADIIAARVAMRAFATDRGRTLGLEMDTIVAPVELEGIMDQATSQTYTDASNNLQQNPVAKWIKRVIYLPGLSDKTDWMGFSTGFYLKPFVFQNRKAPETVIDDTQVKRNKKLIFSAEARGSAGYTLPILGVRTVNG